jgi:hypothetical protein
MNNRVGFLKGDVLNTLVAGLAVVALGAGTAAAAITIGPDSHAAAKQQTLASAKGPTMTRAYGSDDEDCVRMTWRVKGADGVTRVRHRIECEQ